MSPDTPLRDLTREERAVVVTQAQRLIQQAYEADVADFVTYLKRCVDSGLLRTMADVDREIVFMATQSCYARLSHVAALPQSEHVATALKTDHELQEDFEALIGLLLRYDLRARIKQDLLPYVSLAPARARRRRPE